MPRCQSTCKPLGNNLVVEPMEQEEMTAFGIILPETAKEKPQKGRSWRWAPASALRTAKRLPMDVKVGDKVLYAKYGGTEVKIDDKELLILSEDDILAIVE